MKKVELEQMQVGDVVVAATVDSKIVINSQARSVPAAYFTSPAKLRELAAAIGKAADALEKAQRLTFADLKPGEWFRWTRPGPCSPLRKIDDSTIIVTDNFPPYFPHERVVINGLWVDTPVVRLKATFEEVPE